MLSLIFYVAVLLLKKYVTIKVRQSMTVMIPASSQPVEQKVRTLTNSSNENQRTSLEENHHTPQQVVRSTHSSGMVSVKMSCRLSQRSHRQSVLSGTVSMTMSQPPTIKRSPRTERLRKVLSSARQVSAIFQAKEK